MSGGETVPHETVPGDTMPHETVPGDTMPHETVPDETMPAADADLPRRHGWWRHNVVALAAILVLAPATLLVTGGNPWTANPQTSVLPDSRGTVDLAGAEWGPVKAVIPKDTTGLDMPPHTKIVAVAVPVAPHGAASAPVRCDSPRLTEQRTGREWEEVTLELGVPYNPDEPTRCPGDASAARLIVAFAVPDDAQGPYWVDLPGTGAAPSFPRFSVDP